MIKLFYKKYLKTSVFVFFCISFFCPVEADIAHGYSVFSKLYHDKSDSRFENSLKAPKKGGKISLGIHGSFNSLNPFILMGDSSEAILYTTSRLMEISQNEPASNYAYTATGIEVLKDKIIFHLNNKATFSNGDKITAEDVIFSFNILLEKGHPKYRNTYKNIERVESKSDTKVIFYIKKMNKFTPINVGSLPILSKKFFSNRDFEKALKTPMPASGPYFVKDFNFGKNILIEKRENWWGENILSQKNRNNFKNINFSYFYDQRTQFEAFKAGLIDMRLEFSSKNWYKSYNFKNVKNRKIKKLTFKTYQPHMANGLYFNTEKFPWNNIKIRRHISSLFDFDWINKHMFYGLNKKNCSFFPNSPLRAPVNLNSGQKNWISDLKTKFPKESYNHDVCKNNYNKRSNMKSFQRFMTSIGYKINNNFFFEKDGRELSLQILINNKSYDRIFRPFVKILKMAGVNATIRLVDISVYNSIVESGDFDMIYHRFSQNLIPKEEQAEYWGSNFARTKGSSNISRIKNKAIDKTINWMINSNTFEEVINRAQVLDHLLLSGYYAITGWHPKGHYVAVWDKFQIPEPAKYGRIDVTYWSITDDSG